VTKRGTDRREFLKSAGVVAAGVGVAGLGGRLMADTPAAKGKGAPHAEKLGWRLGCQAWTFHVDENNQPVTFYEAMDKTAELGLHFIEAFPGQAISKNGGERLTEKTSADTRKEIKKRLADKGLKLVNFGVGGHSRELFDFAKDMGIETLVSEPAFDAFDEINKMVEEYQINLALHDHPKPSRYWNPDTVLKVCEGRSKRIGACADTGHWMRSDIKPIDAVKKLEGRIISFHFKDLNEFGKGAHDVAWGTGRADIKGILAEVKSQGIKPVFSIEFEYHYGKSMPELAECVAYFDQVAKELTSA
jgi:sugar phosphate isomerase/epimerase